MTVPRESEDVDTVRQNVARYVDETASRNDALVTELLSVYEREARLLGGIRKREAEIARLRSQLVRREAECSSVNDRLDRLLGSKAMRLQRAYWRFRRPGKSAAAAVDVTR